MKKLLAFAFVAAVAASCNKKETSYEQDSTIMLEEPKIEVVDSADATKAADQTVVAAPDSVDVVLDTVNVN